MIRVEHLTKAYRRKVVVDDLSFSVGGGEAVALWGPNGAGKTTVIRCLLGLVGYEGLIEVGGLDVSTHSKSTRGLIGYVPQELGFYGDLTVAETLALSCDLRGLARSRIGEVIEAVSLEAESGKRVAELSGGMRQRLGMAVALLPDPPVLLLDEPTSSLDVTARRRMVSLLDSLRGPERVLVITSHRVEEVGMLVDRVLALDAGRLVHECPPGELTGRLNLESWLHVVLPSSQTAGALAHLTAAGYDAHENGHGVLVGVSPEDKVSALGCLREGDFEIMDFEVWR
ncbi:MAG: ABC transporter ATP-binding protein [Acidimicrobiia bacterium]|nr:ABC transporter ATP-binding protein [Actinomycetota bacterium]MBL6924191.1 ABC transporter ATP-binding protein [Acidimicrobiia bacterium]